MPGAQQASALSQGAAGLPLTPETHRLLKEEQGHSSHEGLVLQEGVQDDPQSALQLKRHRGPSEGPQPPFFLHLLQSAEATAVLLMPHATPNVRAACCHNGDQTWGTETYAQLLPLCWLPRGYELAPTAFRWCAGLRGL